MKIELFKSDTNGEWYFRVRAKNGQVIAASEGYKNRLDALQTAKSLRFGLLFATVVEK